jgi:hypothetical protein
VTRRLTLTMEIPEEWQSQSAIEILASEFKREADRVSLVMHDFHPDVRMTFEDNKASS